MEGIRLLLDLIGAAAIMSSCFLGFSGSCFLMLRLEVFSMTLILAIDEVEHSFKTDSIVCLPEVCVDSCDFSKMLSFFFFIRDDLRCFGDVGSLVALASFGYEGS